ncbi:hypothetical protein ALC62_04059, partial [Cyphomyrmex costatus]
PRDISLSVAVAGPVTPTYATTNTDTLLHSNGMHRVSFYFLKIPMDRMPLPPSVLRTHTHINREKTISSGREGEEERERFARVRKVLVDGERQQGETGLPSRESPPSKDLRAAFHVHFINSNLSPAENWIQLIPVIDAGLCSRIL